MTFAKPSITNCYSNVYLPVRYITLVIFVTFLAFVFSFDAVAKERPKIGIVLGGGGAKGAAHIGVLKALEEMHIPIDYIAGTSMGAYVGGLYASGMSADEIESFLETINWRDGYQDGVQRSDRRVREKHQEDRFQLKTDVGFDLWELKVPKGFVQGQNMGEIIRSTSGNQPEFASFDDLAIPYRAVASDIETLKPVVLDNGDLAKSMQASMSIPGILPPMELDGRLLVDGGITNNLPISVVKAMGADIVIAVDISNDFKKRDELNNYFAIMDQLTDFMVTNNAEQQKKLLTKNDYLIRPDTKGIGTTDFDRMLDAHDIGYLATMALRPQLSKLGGTIPYQNYIDHKQARRHQLTRIDELYIDEVRLVNNSQYSDQALLDRLDLHSGEKMSSEQLAESVRNLYALDRFERINYSIEKNEGKNIVLVDVTEKSWGPNYLDFRFAMEDDFKNSTDYSIGVAFNVTGLSEAGAEWRTELEYGYNKRAATEIYMPFISDQEWFGLLRAEYDKSNKYLALGNNDDDDDEPKLSDTELFIPTIYNTTTFDASVGWQPMLWQEMRLGYRYIIGEVDYQGLAGTILGVRERNSRVGYVNYNIDTLDDFELPSKGNLFSIEFALSDDRVDWTVDGERLQGTDLAYHLDIAWKGAYTYQRHTLMGKTEFGHVESEEDIQLDPKEIGGFLNLSGIPKNSLVGNNKIFSAAIYRYRITDYDFGLFKSPVYVGGSIEWGGVYNESSTSFNELPMYWAGSVFTGINSPIGPFLVAYGRTEENYDSFYLFIGGAF